jgi:hypothetical protein
MLKKLGCTLCAYDAEQVGRVLQIFVVVVRNIMWYPPHIARLHVWRVRHAGENIRI